MLSKLAFKLNLRRYSMVAAAAQCIPVAARAGVYHASMAGR